MVKTRVFTSGNSQAIRIPKEFHIEQSEIFIKKIGTTLILYPVNSQWEHLRQSLSEFSDDFMVEGRNQPILQVREEF